MTIASRVGVLVREARLAAGLTQAELAGALGTTQSAIARLESPAANPRVETLTRALSACDRELALEARLRESSVDQTLVAARLRLSPGDRIKSFERSYANVREVALAGARSRGELA
jgi:transcriptional regulator with XRE-family HTH domain